VVAKQKVSLITLFNLVALSGFLPLADMISDLWTCAKVWSIHYGFGLALLIPIIIHLLLTLPQWWKHESKLFAN